MKAMKAGKVTKPMKASKAAKADSELQSFIDETNLEYERVHKVFEDQFWGTKMALKEGEFSKELLTSTKSAMEAFLADKARHQQAQALLASRRGTKEQKKILKIFDRTFSCYLMK